MDNSVQISISDTGCGIPADVGNKLFEKFAQVTGKHHLSKGGFGIGLYLVKHFVEQHVGTISYESTEGKGTTFRFTLHKGRDHFNKEIIYQDVSEESVFLQELAGEDKNSEAENSALLKEKELKKSKDLLTELVTEQQTILIIDDDMELRKYIVQLFADDFIVIEAENGEEGDRLAKHHLPDIIISDINMQGDEWY